MSTYALPGFAVAYDYDPVADEDIVSQVIQAELRATFRAGEGVLNYSVIDTFPDDLPDVDIGGDDPLGVLLAGPDVPGGITALPDDSIDSIGYVDTPAGRHVLMVFEIPGEPGEGGVDVIFPIGGDPLAIPTSIQEFEALETSITDLGAITSGAFAPNTDIPISGFPGVTVTNNNQVIGDGTDNTLTGTAADDDVIGLGGNDTLDGGAGNDYINPSAEGEPSEWDTVIGSTGNDQIDLTLVSPDDGYIELDYTGLSGPISVGIDGDENIAAVNKGSDGVDTIVDVENPLFAGWTDGGLAVNGTASADTFSLDIADLQWMELRPGDGQDQIELSGPGLARIDFRGAANGIDVDLSTNTINDDGFGNTETIVGNTPWGIRGSEHDDVFLGSGSDDKFRKVGGNDTLDGGGGMDRARYDASGLSGLEADLAAGTVTGTINGVAFNDTLINFEQLRGSSGDDWLAGDNSGGFNILEGRGGADTFVPGLSQTQISGFVPGVSTLDVGRLGVTIAQAESALQSAFDNGYATVANLPGGPSIAFVGLTEADVAGITPVSVDGGPSPTQGTDGDDYLTGTPGDDMIVTGDATPQGDQLIASTGDDSIDMSGMNQSQAWFMMDYSGLGNTIDVVIDGAANTGTIDKGGLGTDTLIDVENPLFSGWNLGGLSLLGTSGDDSYYLAPGAQQWMSVRPGDGTDSFSINGDGAVRLDFTDAITGIDVNLATGQIADDGFGNTETITGTAPLWEVYGSGLDDVFSGSANGESYRYAGGDNTLDGGAGFDRLRYDSFTVASVTIDAQDGNVTGSLNGGGTFTDTIAGFERLRGSNGDDHISGEATVDNRYEGKGGSDVFVHLGGVDTISDFDAASETLVVRLSGLDQAQVDAAVSAASDTADGARVDFGGGNEVIFSGLTVADIGSSDIQYQDPALAGAVIGTPGVEAFNGTPGDDTIIGNGGDDQFNLGDGNDVAFVGEGNPYIRAGFGDDTYHFTDIVEGYVEIQYGHMVDGAVLGNGLSVDIDGVANTGTIVKGTVGTDTLVDVENPLDAGATIGGLGIDGTFGDDTFNLTLANDQWMQVRASGGGDTFNIESGYVRISYDDGNSTPIDADLVAGTITRSDGFSVSTDTIGGARGAWEIQATDSTDTILGSGNDESFILRGGDDTLDGGGGSDRLRYDRDFVNGGIDADLAAGTVTGTAIVGGENWAFTHTISNIEHIRGTDADDRIAGDMNDNRLEGKGGQDAFVLVGGNDTVEGGDGFDQVFFGVTADQATVTNLGGDNYSVVIGSDTVTLDSIEDLIFEEPGGPGATPPAPSGAVPAWTLGDPHLLTLDGLGYDFQAVGEYVLLRGQSGESVNGFEIQSRMTPAKDDQGADLDNVSVNAAIAMRAANGDAVMIDSNDTNPLSINGTSQTLADGENLDVGDDRIYRSGDTYTAVFAGDDGIINDGDTQVAVVVHDGRVDLSVRISDELAGKLEGLLGDGDGDKSNDVALANGTVLERPLAFEDLYGDYRDDWRVDSGPDSLFTYDTGESLAGFYDPSKPGSVTTVDDFDPADQQAAQQQAEASGLTPGTVNYDNAVLDFLLTGDQSFVESAANEEVAAPETASVASTLDQGQARATLQITVKDRDGFDVDGAQVGFSAGNTTALNLADSDGSGDYSLSVGEGTSGRVNGTMEFTNASNTITSADALDVLRLAVGFEPSWGTSEGMDFVAADVTRDGQVTSADALEVLRAAAGFESPGGTAPKWVFLDQNLDVSGADQNSVPTDEGVDVAAIGAGGAFVSLEAVLLGDMAAFDAV